MKTFEQIISSAPDLEVLLKELDLSDESLNQAALSQGHLYMEASKFFVRCMDKTASFKAQLKEREALRAQYFRAKDRINQAKGNKASTEARINELVALSPSVKKLTRLLNRSKSKEEWGRLLLEAFKMRRDSIKILSDVLSDESRSELRVVREEKAKEELKHIQGKLKNRYPREEEI